MGGIRHTGDQHVSFNLGSSDKPASPLQNSNFSLGRGLVIMSDTLLSV